MAERLVSPGVFTQEKDLSFLPQGIAEIGAAFVGGFSSGPAFTPTVVSSQADFSALFGDPIPQYYTGYAVQYYLRDASKATIVRVLGLSGYDNVAVQSQILYASGSGGQYPFAVIHPSRGGVTLSAAFATGSPLNFTLSLSGSQFSSSYASQSLVSTLSNYVIDTFGQDPSSAKDGYVYAVFPHALDYISGSTVGSGSVSVAAAGGALMLSGSVYGVYSEAVTPWFRSQTLGGSRINLFRLHTRGDGNSANQNIKVSIASVAPSSTAGDYGTFSIVVRDFNDTDGKISILEQFDNLTLDSTSPDFISRRIGDTYPVVDTTTAKIHFEGDYPNLSRYIYVELDPNVANAPVAALPYGFASLHPPINTTVIPAPTYINTRYYVLTGTSSSVANNRTYYGLDFTNTTNLSYLNPLPSGSANISIGSEFSLETVADGDVTGSLTSATSLAYRKFTAPFQGGFDGMNPARTFSTAGNISATNTQGFDLSTGTSPGSIAFNLALNTIADPENFDINVLVIPGALYQYHPYIVQQAITLCENRGDCFYIMDSNAYDANVDTAVNNVVGLDTNYAATYYPWVQVRDVNTNQNLWVPPSVVLPQVYAFSDKIAAEWFSPAGLTRGGIGSALQVRQRLSKADRDELYPGRVNPIATFPGQGVAVWGQKTLQQLASSLDRINVRRLLIALRKYIASVSRYLVFEQNVDSTRTRFLNIVNPYLASVQERSGLYAFKVVMDDTNNTPDIIDRNILYGQIYIQPTKTAEYILLDFNITPTGASFTE